MCNCFVLYLVSLAQLQKIYFIRELIFVDKEIGEAGTHFILLIDVSNLGHDWFSVYALIPVPIWSKAILIVENWHKIFPFQVIFDFVLLPDARLFRGAASTWNEHHINIGVIVTCRPATKQFLRVGLVIKAVEIVCGSLQFNSLGCCFSLCRIELSHVIFCTWL